MKAIPYRNPAQVRRIEQALTERILVFDGAMGTSIQALDLTAADFGGAELEGCNEYLVVTKPDAIRRIHEEESVSSLFMD